MTPEFTSRRRFLLFGILPVSLLMIAVPLAPHVTPPVQGFFREMSARRAAAAKAVFQPPVQVSQADYSVYRAPRISPSIQPGLRQGRRTLALDVISRLEEEARRKGGTTHLTRLDLKRLRNALRDLREAESIESLPSDNKGSDLPAKSLPLPSSDFARTNQ